MEINELPNILKLVEQRKKLKKSIEELSLLIENIKDPPELKYNQIKISGFELPFSDSSLNSIINYSHSLLLLDLQNIEKELMDAGVKLERESDEQTP